MITDANLIFMCSPSTERSSQLDEEMVAKLHRGWLISLCEECSWCVEANETVISFMWLVIRYSAMCALLVRRWSVVCVLRLMRHGMLLAASIKTEECILYIETEECILYIVH